MRRVYVAGASAEIERAERVIAALRERGISVTSSWPESVREYGANPREASNEERLGWASDCLTDVRVADVLLVLVPRSPATTIGAWVELGYAVHADLPIVLAGDSRQTVFGALGDECENDEDAIERVVELARRM